MQVSRGQQGAGTGHFPDTRHLCPQFILMSSLLITSPVNWLLPDSWSSHFLVCAQSAGGKESLRRGFGKSWRPTLPSCGPCALLRGLCGPHNLRRHHGIQAWEKSQGLCKGHLYSLPPTVRAACTPLRSPASGRAQLAGQARHAREGREGPRGSGEPASGLGSPPSRAGQSSTTDVQAPLGFPCDRSIAVRDSQLSQVWCGWLPRGCTASAEGALSQEAEAH